MTSEQGRLYGGDHATTQQHFALTPGIEDRMVFRRRPELIMQLDAHTRAFLESAGRTTLEVEDVTRATNLYAASRFDRGLELSSKDVERARQLSQIYFQGAVNDQVFVGHDLCMDSRTRKTIETGVPGRFGGSLRSPGGRHEGFVRRGFGDELHLDPGSNYAGEISAALRAGGYVLQLKDAHYGCAKANDAEATVLGDVPREHGIREDRRYKGKMIEATEALMGHQGIGEKLVFVRYSFDPKTGYLDLLDEETYEDAVLSTRTLAEGPLHDIFGAYEFDLDWLDNYETSAYSFWHNLLQIQPNALPFVKDELRKVYPTLESADPTKFEFKSRVALANAYSGWLLNRGGEYPFAEHKEDLVVALSGGEHGPFKETESFEIPRDAIDFRSVALYAASLVRKFRTIGDRTTPVPLIMQYRVDLPTEADVQLVAELASEVANDLPRREWTEMDYRQATKHVISEFGGGNRVVPAEFCDAIAEMVRSMANIYDPRIQDDFRESIYRGSIVPVPMLVDANRAPIAVISLLPKVR